MTLDIKALRDMLARHEGRRNTMYSDSLGISTIGIGHNLRDKPISDAAVDQIFNDDLNDVLAYAEKQTYWTHIANDDVRQRAVLNLLFQLGSLDRFPNALSCLNKGDFRGFADNMQFRSMTANPLVRTPWAEESGDRANEILFMLRQGRDRP